MAVRRFDSLVHSLIQKILITDKAVESSYRRHTIYLPSPNRNNLYILGDVPTYFLKMIKK
jgi:hypothetical protein